MFIGERWLDVQNVRVWPPGKPPGALRAAKTCHRCGGKLDPAYEDDAHLRPVDCIDRLRGLVAEAEPYIQVAVRLARSDASRAERKTFLSEIAAVFARGPSR